MTPVAELFYEELVSEEWIIDASQFDDSQTGLALQKVDAQFIISPYVYDDDILDIKFSLDLPESFVQSGLYYKQYLQLYVANVDIDAKTNPLRTVACMQEVDVEGHTLVMNYVGVNSFNSANEYVNGRNFSAELVEDIEVGPQVFGNTTENW